MKMKWLLMMLMVVGLMAGAAQANMLANPSFEDGTFAAQGVADGWTVSYTSWTSAWTWFNDSAGAHSGSKYIKLNGWSTGSDNYYYQWLTGDFSTTDTFGVWAKAAAGKTADAAVALYWYDSASVKIGGTIHLTPTTVGDQWTYVEWTSPAPAGAVGMYYSLEGLFSNGGVNSGGSVNADGGIYYDDVKMFDPNAPDAGVDMITWSGKPVSLDPTVVDDGASALTYLWTADPADGVSWPDGDNVVDPNVTIDKSGFLTTLVLNPGFESPELDDNKSVTARRVPTWSEGYYTGAETTWDTWNGACGAIDPDAAYGYGGVAPEGENIAWCTTDAGYDDGVSQTLPVALKAETQYDLSAKVGTPAGALTPASWRIELLAGNVKVKETSGTAPDPNQWTTASLTHNSGSAGTDPTVGQTITIRLLATDDNGTSGVAVNFDDVKLTAAPAYPFPAVHTVTLTLAVHDENNPPEEDTMSIDVYDDACHMVIYGLGLSEITDFDKNCITDLRDFAVFAAAWLDGYAATDPVPKP